MNSSADAADQIVRMYLEGVEVAAKLSGSAAKHVAVMLYAVLKDQTKTKGKTRLSSMLRSGKELKVFAVRDGDLERFRNAAKEYGVLYCVLKDRDANDGITDVMVRAEDAPKINRIFERFKLATVDLGDLRSEIMQEKKPQEKSKEDILLDQLLGIAPVKDANPTQATMEKSNPSEPISDPGSRDFMDISEADNRPSVREQIKKIRRRRALQANPGKIRTRDTQNQTQNVVTKVIAKAKERSR